jgi:hypothetical protein
MKGIQKMDIKRNGNSTDWMEKVSDEQYQGGLKADKKETLQ